MFQVLEVRPVIDWNKGKAVEFLLESLGKQPLSELTDIDIDSSTPCLNGKMFWIQANCTNSGAGLNGRDDVLSIYIGDDRTDEDAFKVIP